jgi:hypothetical protein
VFPCMSSYSYVYWSFSEYRFNVSVGMWFIFWLCNLRFYQMWWCLSTKMIGWIVPCEEREGIFFQVHIQSNLKYDLTYYRNDIVL